MMQIDSSSARGAPEDGDYRRQQIGSRTNGLVSWFLGNWIFLLRLQASLGGRGTLNLVQMLSKKNALVSFMGFEFPYCCKVLLMLKFFFNHTLKLHNPPENIIHK